MNKLYPSFYKMLKGTASHKFCMLYYCAIGFFNELNHAEAYQDLCRVYLDEYPEQKEIRTEWFKKHHDVFKHIYTRFLKRN